MPILRRGAIAWSPWALAPGHCVSLQRLDGIERLSQQAEADATSAKARAHADAAAGVLGTTVDGPLPRARSLLPMLHITKPIFAVVKSDGVHATPQVNALLAHMTVHALREQWGRTHSASGSATRVDS